ncbi:MAG: ABC transporter ATP-binding protein [Lachnospiraceae bacterium]
MIRTINISKKFDDVLAVDRITATIKDGQVFGLIGTNGAGKSTFLRMISGVILPDEGDIEIDEMPVFENKSAKELFFYISDEQFFFINAKPMDMANYYKNLFPNFDIDKFVSYLAKFDLPQNRKIKTFSKGMKKQLSVILGISANTKYILCDETFDGLDPVMRQGIKSIFAKEIAERGLTPIIASHNLREIEDICEHIGLLYRGGMLLSSDLDSLKLGIFKIQCVFPTDVEQALFEALDVVTHQKRGSLYTLTIRGSIEKIEGVIKGFTPTFYEILPLTLEEIFITETEARGYDIKKLIR